MKQYKDELTTIINQKGVFDGCKDCPELCGINL